MQTVIKVGSIVHLNGDSEITFTVTVDIGANFKNGTFKNMVTIVSIDKKHDNKPIELSVRKEALTLVEK